MMLLAVIIGLFVIFIVYVFSLNNSKSISTEKLSDVRSSNTRMKHTASKGSLPFVYKNIKIRNFDMVGMYYRIGEEKKYIGNFNGYAECEYNEYDYYAVGIYNKNHVQLGYVPRGNMWLHNSIEHYHSRKVFCWGSLAYDNKIERWFGTVFIPVGFSYTDILKIEKFLNLSEITNKAISNGSLEIKDYFLALDNISELLKLKEGFNNTIFLPHSHFNPVIIRLSKILEDSGKWEELVRLEGYSIVINGLNIRFQNSILKRIEKAKSILTSKESGNGKADSYTNNNSISKQNSSTVIISKHLEHNNVNWETPRAYWSSVQLPGYRYSEKKKAWWKQKPY